MRWALGDADASLRLGRDLFAKARADPEAARRKLLSLACGLADGSCLGPVQAAASRAWLTAALAAAPPPPAAAGDDLAYLSLLHLYRGYMEDALGRRQEALADYGWALAQPDFWDVHARAQRCSAAPCPPREVLSYLRALSRQEQHP
jgi:hypothetical protein